jgi:hypothetical protein
MARSLPVDSGSQEFYAAAKQRIPSMTLICEEFFDHSLNLRGGHRAISVDEAE